MAETPDVLEVKKDLLPYECVMLLAGEQFGLKFNYNATADLFTVDLYRDGELICAGEPIMYGVPLWQDVYRAETFPAVNIIPTDPSGENNAVTYDNLGETVLLILDNGSDGEESGEQATATRSKSTTSGGSSGGTGGDSGGGEGSEGSGGGSADNPADGDCECEHEYLTAEELEAILNG